MGGRRGRNKRPFVSPSLWGIVGAFQFRRPKALENCTHPPPLSARIVFKNKRYPSQWIEFCQKKRKSPERSGKVRNDKPPPPKKKEEEKAGIEKGYRKGYRNMCPRSLCRREASHIRTRTLEAVSIFYFKTSRARACVCGKRRAVELWDLNSNIFSSSSSSYFPLTFLCDSAAYFTWQVRWRERGRERERERESRLECIWGRDREVRRGEKEEVGGLSLARSPKTKPANARLLSLEEEGGGGGKGGEIPKNPIPRPPATNHAVPYNTRHGPAANHGGPNWPEKRSGGPIYNPRSGGPRLG